MGSHTHAFGHMHGIFFVSFSKATKVEDRVPNDEYHGNTLRSTTSDWAKIHLKVNKRKKNKISTILHQGYEPIFSIFYVRDWKFNGMHIVDCRKIYKQYNDFVPYLQEVRQSIYFCQGVLHIWHELYHLECIYSYLTPLHSYMLSYDVLWTNTLFISASFEDQVYSSSSSRIMILNTTNVDYTF